MIKMVSNKANPVNNTNWIDVTTAGGGGGGSTVYWTDTTNNIKMPTYITDIRRYIKLDGTEELQLKMGGNWQRVDVQYEASEIMEKL